MREINQPGKTGKKKEELHKQLYTKKRELTDLAKETESMQRELDSTHEV